MLNASSISEANPPMFRWAAEGGSSDYPNNSFALIIYDYAGTEILRTSTTTSVTYTLTQSEWSTVINNCGNVYTVAVAAMQTNYPTTGEYVSEKSISYNRSDIHFHSYIHHYEQSSDAQHKAYCECGEYILQDHLVFGGTTCCGVCGEPHTHDYTDHYARDTDSVHKSYCACGASRPSAHVVSGSVGGVFGKRICIFCGEIVDAGLSIMSPVQLPHTENGSYIMPNGIIVLMDEDMTAYLEGTLEFIYPTDVETE